MTKCPSWSKENIRKKSQKNIYKKWPTILFFNTQSKTHPNNWTFAKGHCFFLSFSPCLHLLPGFFHAATLLQIDLFRCGPLGFSFFPGRSWPPPKKTWKNGSKKTQNLTNTNNSAKKKIKQHNQNMNLEVKTTHTFFQFGTRCLTWPRASKTLGRPWDIKDLLFEGFGGTEKNKIGWFFSLCF